MSDSQVDFAIFGSTPLARLLAGLLFRQHRKRVVLIGDSQAAFRLPRGIDLSVGPITRPETWALLAQTLPETKKLIARIGGKAGMSRIDPVFFVETPAGRQGLAFIRHVAAGFDHAVERLAPGALGPDREGILLRDAVQLHRPQLEPALDRWLDQLKIRRFLDADISAVLHADGGARITSDGDNIEAASVILADDAAILAHLHGAQIGHLFDIEHRATILTEPTTPLVAPVMLQIDSGLCLAQPASHGVIAISPGDLDSLVRRLGMVLPSHRLRRAGQSTHTAMVSRDHAPVVGRIDQQGPIILTNLGPTGAFLTPALARWIAGKGIPSENAYLDAHSPVRALAPSMVAEYGPARSAEIAA